MPNLRIVFAIVWLGVQLALVSTSGSRPDGAFGFRMFPEATTTRIALFRELGEPGTRKRVRVEGGSWMGFRLDAETTARYGGAAQLDRLQHALDWAIAHPDDSETRRLVAEVSVRKNGHEPVLHTLASHER